MESTKSLAAERQGLIHEIVGSERIVRVEDLCQRLNVSPATVRRDLADLEGRGVVRRVHGGAMSIESRLDEPLFDDKASISVREKRAIAAYAAGLVGDGETVYLDGGSTLLEMARLLKNRSGITIVTNSLRAAIELSGLGPNLIMVGGALRRRSQTLVGGLSQVVLNELFVDRAFMGTIGVTIEEGMTTTNGDEAFTKKLAMARAREVLLLADSSKIGNVAFANAGEFEKLNVLITDRGVEKEFVEKAENRGVKVVVVEC